MDEWRRNFEHGIVWCGVAYYGMQTVISSMEGEERKGRASMNNFELEEDDDSNTLLDFRDVYSNRIFIYLSIYLFYLFTYSSSPGYASRVMCFTM